MFVGHYSAAFVAKAAETRVPFWVLLLAAQLVDVFWIVFVLCGVEHVRIDPSLASNPLDLHHMPYTHSLVGTALWSVAAGGIVAGWSRLGGTARAGAVVGLVVASHWLLDLAVHRPDLTLWGSPPKLGLSLWDAPVLAFLLEIALLAGSVAFYAVHRAAGARGRKSLAIFVAALVAVQASVALGPVPPGVPTIVISLGVVFAAVAHSGIWLERRTREATAVR